MTASVDYLIVPLRPVPVQQLNVVLGGQPCTIKVYTKNIDVPESPPGAIPTDPPIYISIDPIFMDLYVDGKLVLSGILCLNGVRIVRDVYLGFVGDLSIIDTQGSDDPQVAGLGSRWLLTYWPNLL